MELASIWNIAISVAGIGSVGLLVLYLLYNKWLQLPIFSTLTKDQTFKLMVLFLILVFLAVIVAIYAYMTQSKVRNNKEESKLELVEASFDLIDPEGLDAKVYPTLDVKVRNTGEQVSFIKKATFYFKKRWPLAPVGRIIEGKVPPEIYLLDIPRRNPPFNLDQTLSHNVKPADVDHFGFTFTINHGNGEFIDSVFLIEGKIFANAADLELDIPPFLFLASSPGNIFCPLDLGDYDENKDHFKDFSNKRPKAIEHNQKLVQELIKVKASRNLFVERIIRFYAS